ncbi:MAG: ABC transporter substrate-binding protein [Actinomycetota bacterium]|nr:ABC transporter substrate-binding protein [Actinomycetota bacterium]
MNVSLNEGITSWNSATAHGNSVYNAYPLYLTQALAGYYDSDLKFWDNTGFLTCKELSKSPVKVEYTINKAAKWSDGVPVTNADMLLFWVAESGYYNTGAAQYDKDGNLIKTADIAFDSSSDAMHAIHHFPTLSADGQSMTVTYDDFYVDWQLNAPTGGMPAHVVAMKALGESDPVKATKDLVTALQSFNAKATSKTLKDGSKAADTTAVDKTVVTSVKKISDFWNTGFDFTQLPSDPSLYLSDGAYKMTAFKKDAYMTFEANPDYTWGPKPAIAKITYQIIGDAMASVQALQNGEVDVINPQATSDVLGAVQGLANQGITTQTGDGGTYEHVDMAENNKGPFDPATYGGGAAGAKKALMVRQAFLKVIPRQEIINKLIKPLNPKAVVRNSFNLVPGAPGYDANIAANGSAAYKDVDIAGAKALLAQAGVPAPKVRFMYADNNARRAQEYKLIATSASQAGFQMVDGKNAKWSSQLSNTKIYDAVLFGWQNTNTGVSQIPPNFETGGQNNFYGYSNPEVDKDLKTLNQTTDPAKQQALILDTEKHLWADAFGTVLFQFPDIVSFNSKKVTGLKHLTIVPGYFWNFWEWTVPAA